MRIGKLCKYLIVFILCNLLSTSCALAQCMDCDDKINTSANCDDSNPCTMDSQGADGCIHDLMSCDDGNSNTSDFCSPSGCVNNPLPVERSEVYSVDLPGPVLPEMQNETASENTIINEIINESQSSIDVVAIQPICDDENPCTTDAYNNGTGCLFTIINCDDGNESTIDSCKDGSCINEPIDGGIISENNSTALSSSDALMAGHPHSCDDHNPCTVDAINGTGCEHKEKICDDGNPSTFDYCYGGVCYNTTTSCDDGNNCTTDSFDGSVCVHRQKNCDDRNACTIDTCDNGKCLHSPVVCGRGKTCINGVCQRLNYQYVEPYYPYAAPPRALPSTQSYTIPAATAIVLPWSRSVTALDTLKVDNGIAYSSAMFSRSLGLAGQSFSGYQSPPSISERAEMIGLSWKDASFTLTLIQPDGRAFSVQSDNQNVIHLSGSNYDYYFLRSPAKGIWGIEVKPINPGANGVGFSLITGLVKGAAPIK